MRDGERERGGGRWVYSHSQRRSFFSRVERKFRGEGVQVGCHKRGDGGDWFDVRPRRRKALRQDGRGQDKRRESSRFGDRDGSRLRQSRVREASREDRYSWDRYQEGVVSECEDGQF